MDGQISLAELYYTIYNSEILIKYDKDRISRNSFYRFNYNTSLWDSVSKEILASDISERLSNIIKPLLLRFLKNHVQLIKILKMKILRMKKYIRKEN